MRYIICTISDEWEALVHSYILYIVYTYMYMYMYITELSSNVMHITRI